MTHENQLVADLISNASATIFDYLACQPEDRRQRADGIQQIGEELIPLIVAALYAVIFAWLNTRADAVAGSCRTCGRRTRRERADGKLRTKRGIQPVPAIRYRCRECKTSTSPVRDWLGLQSGMTTGGFDRCASSLALKGSFGSAAEELEEQHGHSVNRTLVERRTYAVGRDAVEFLEERRQKRRNEVMNAVGVRPGVPRITVQVDGGGVPVGRLQRPPPEQTTERTPVRGLPKGRRPKAKREVRVCMAWEDGVVEARAVDLHIAPHNKTEVSGARLYHVALEAGLGDDTHVHCICDMAPWHRNQFEEQFSAQDSRSLCADFYHAFEYVAMAGRCLGLSDEDYKQWVAVSGSLLKKAQRDEILASLSEHTCGDGGCVKTDRGECAARAARRYLRKFGEFMDYPAFIEDGLGIGSGAVEGRIRHLIRRRLDVPADWREENVHLMLALLSIRESGLWDDFWQWRDAKDRKRFRGRLKGEGLNRFRGNKPEPVIAQGTEALDFTGILAPA